MRSRNGMSMSPSGMEGQAGAAGLSPGGDGDSAEWPRPPPPPPRPLAVQPREQSQRQAQAQAQGSQHSSPSLDVQDAAERPSAAGLRSSFRIAPDAPSGSLRAVTPDLIDARILGRAPSPWTRLPCHHPSPATSGHPRSRVPQWPSSAPGAAARAWSSTTPLMIRMRAPAPARR